MDEKKNIDWNLSVRHKYSDLWGNQNKKNTNNKFYRNSIQKQRNT